jgi:hypothetical protein
MLELPRTSIGVLAPASWLSAMKAQAALVGTPIWYR